MPFSSAVSMLLEYRKKCLYFTCRKLQSRAALQQDSSESLLDVPIQELQRRHSEARLGGGLMVGGVGSGLAPPRSPELRRHSDVSPASLKELEKVRHCQRNRQQTFSVMSTALCLSILFQLKGGGAKTPDPDWSRGRGGRSQANSRANSPPREPAAPTIQPSRSRRASRVARQHSYDDEVKNSLTPNNTADTGLGLPAPMPRRASAYDVFSVPGAGAVTAPPVSAGRRASFRVPPPENSSPPSPETVPTVLMAPPDEDRRTRRRGSQL